MDESFDRGTSRFDHERFDHTEEKSKTNQRLAGLQHEVQQPRLAVEPDVKADKKTRKRTEGAPVDDEKHGDISSARAVHGPMISTSFGNIAEPSALPVCRDDALVDKGAEGTKLCLSPVEMRTLTAAGEILPAGTASTTLRTIFPLPPPLWGFCPAENMDFSKTTAILTSATYSSF